MSEQHQREFSLIGATGFEPATFRPPAECATRLRHAPKGYLGSSNAEAGDRTRTGSATLEGSNATCNTSPAVAAIIDSVSWTSGSATGPHADNQPAGRSVVCGSSRRRPHTWR